MEQPEVRYCMTDDGVRLAYYVLGVGAAEGATALVRAAGFPSHLTGIWKMPGAEDGTRRLAAEHQVVTYDPRGMGLSQRVLDFSLETRIADLRTIVRHLGLGRFALHGGGHSSPLAMAYAARYPDQVTHLVLSAPYADGPQLYTTSPAFAAYAALESVTLDQWDFVVNTIAHRIAGFDNVSGANEMASLIKSCISAEGYVAYRRDNRMTSVVSELGSIEAPTLVVASQDDEIVPPELSQDVAARIPGARFHLDVTARQGLFLNDFTTEIVLDFLRPEGAPRPAREEPQTQAGARIAHGAAVILFTDIASSTELTERMGDAAFREASRALDAGLRAAIRDAGGVAVEGKLLGDGVLATFGSAAQAIDGARRCLALSAASELGLHIGLHAGDVIREEVDGRRDVFGGAVNIAARICGLSAPGEILVSDVVRGMARTSAGVVFEDRGERDMKGVGEAVRVYGVSTANSKEQTAE